MSLFQKETVKEGTGWTVAAAVVGAGVLGFVAYKYYKNNLKGGSWIFYCLIFCSIICAFFILSNEFENYICTKNWSILASSRFFIL